MNVSLSSLTTQLRADAGARRVAKAERTRLRVERARLRTELRSYSTPGERAELDAILSRHTAEETAEVTALLR